MTGLVADSKRLSQVGNFFVGLIHPITILNVFIYWPHYLFDDMCLVFCSFGELLRFLSVFCHFEQKMTHLVMHGLDILFQQTQTQGN